jgi:putative transposase
MNETPAAGRTAKRSARVPAALGGGIEEDIARVIERAQAEGLTLTGEGGLLPDMIKRAVEAAMNAEMSDHLGYERYAAEGRGSGNSRNGVTSSTVQTNAGWWGWTSPRTATASSTRWWCPRGLAG